MEADSRVLAVTMRQHGVMSREQALGAGLSPTMIERRLACGQWVGVYRGVYRMGAVPSSWYQALWAALLRLGPGTVVSHRAVAAL